MGVEKSAVRQPSDLSLLERWWYRGCCHQVVCADINFELLLYSSSKWPSGRALLCAFEKETRGHEARAVELSVVAKRHICLGVRGIQLRMEAQATIRFVLVCPYDDVKTGVRRRKGGRKRVHFSTIWRRIQTLASDCRAVFHL
jgi:hypothetical protein